MTGLAFHEYAANFSSSDACDFDGAAGALWRSPYEILRETTDLAAMRSNGTFFTGEALAGLLWEAELDSLSDASIVLDPACGAGDLVLPVILEACQRGLKLTVRLNDIEESFLHVARTRIETLSPLGSVVETTNFDFLGAGVDFSGVSHVVMNPPYFPILAERGWAAGVVNAGAIFVDEALARMPSGSTLLALLPDVLRSGSRYAKWRAHVEAAGQILKVAPQGRFDKDTDVHVFLLTLTVGARGPHADWIRASSAAKSVGDVCDVRVGPVVPHRDPEAGPTVPFVTARNLTAGTQERRAYAGRLESGPMVLVNRTSRPGDIPRVRVRIRKIEEESAIENHLIVVKPKAGSTTTCEEIAAALESDEARHFLDDRIRCRHLTVKALKEIPWSN